MKLTGTYFNTPSEYVETLIHEPPHIFGAQDYQYGKQAIEGATQAGFPMYWNADSYSLFALGR